MNSGPSSLPRLVETRLCSSGVNGVWTVGLPAGYWVSLFRGVCWGNLVCWGAPISVGD